MKTINTNRTHTFKKRLLGVLVTAMFSTGALTIAMAVGTASGISISNSATVDYKVATVDQATITSNTYVFKVDNKVDLTVSTIDVAAVSVTPGTNISFMTFLVTNTGNTVQDFDLSAVALAGGAAKFGGTDNIDANATAIYVEEGSTPSFQSGEDTLISYIDELSADANKSVYVLGNFGTGFSDGDIASYYLVAEAHKGSTPAALGAVETESAGDDADPLVVDIVLADGAGDNDGLRDAKHSSQDDYEIAMASLTVIKTSTVTWDPFNLAVTPKRIPGSIIEYTITISNAGGASTATNIAFSDSLNTEIATNGYLAFNTQYDATAGQGIVVAHPDFSGGADTEYTNADDGVVNGISVDWDVTGTNVVTVTGITLDAGDTATVKFRVTVQ
jgi:uncharacterized repeat protein (TIGR01451 family)